MQKQEEYYHSPGATAWKHINSRQFKQAMIKPN